MPPRRRTASAPPPQRAPAGRSVGPREATIFPGGTLRWVPLTDDVVQSLSRAYGERTREAFDAMDYRAAARAAARLTLLADAYAAVADATREAALAAWGEAASARLLRALRDLSPEWIRPPLRFVEADQQRAEFQRFGRARGAWDRESRARAVRAWSALTAAAAASPPLVLAMGREEVGAIGGARAAVGPMDPRTAARAAAALREAMGVLRAQRRVPWLVRSMPPLRLTLACERGGRRVTASYAPAAQSVTVCAPSAAEADPRELAQTLAHEAAHHVWRTSLSGDAKRRWAVLVESSVERVPVARLLDAWPEGWGLGRALARLREVDPRLALQVEILDARGPSLDRDALAGLPRGAALAITGAPVSAYGGLNPEEAFCEAVGLLAAYGPRAVLPEVQEWLAEVSPGVRPKANARAGSPRRTKRNSAIAARDHSRDEVRVDRYGDSVLRRVDEREPSRLTEGHWSEPDVVRAVKIAASTQSGYEKYLGEGNFGVVYGAEDGGQRRAVKVPSAYNIHRQPWTREQQIENIRHEAGVANELAAMGYTVVPRGVYTEWRGTPTFVREYGEPAETITGREYGDLEEQLVSIERDRGWRVHDVIEPYRRPDGSLFVADLSIWQAPPSPARPWVPGGAFGTGLGSLLEGLQKRLLPGLAVAPQKVPLAAGYEHEARVPVPTLPWLLAKVAHIRDDATWLRAGKVTALAASGARRFLEAIDAREAVGVPTPEDIRSAAPLAHEVIRLATAAGDDEDDE